MGAEDESGIDILQARLERRKRVVAPPREPVSPPAFTRRPGMGAQETSSEPDPGRNAEPEPAPRDEGKVSPQAAVAPAAQAKQGASTEVEPIVPGPDEPFSNLSVRVRRSLDDRVTDLVHELRGHGVRISKAELMEVVLSDLPVSVTPEFVARINLFRQNTPRVH